MKYLKIIPLALLFVGLASCDVLDQKPQQSISPDQVFTDQRGAENALGGVYNDIEGVNDDNILFAELASDLARHTGSFPTWGDIDANDLDASNVSADNTWIDWYEVINDANVVISNTPDVPDETFSQAERDNVIGQAHALRAYAHHLNIMWYGTQPNAPQKPNLGVPIVTQPTENFSDPEAAKIPRNETVATYDQIVSDLNQAISLLEGNPESPSPVASAFITEWGAKALLARVYLDGADRGVFPNGYQEALTLANDVIDNGPFTLVPSYATIFEEGQRSAEAIWEMPFTSEDDNALSFFSRPNGSGGRFEYGPTGTLAGLYSAGDERADVNLRTIAGTQILGKYFRLDGSDNMVVLRLAEMILVSAEADIKANPGDALARQRAIDKLDQIRNRAGAGDSGLDATNSDQEIIDAIIEERAREFTQEGIRWHDLVRTNKAETDLGLADENTRWPVPQREIDANPQLEQNPGY